MACTARTSLDDDMVSRVIASGGGRAGSDAPLAAAPARTGQGVALRRGAGGQRRSPRGCPTQHAQAKVLLSGLLDALTAIRTTAKAYPVAQRLLQVPSPPYDGQAATEMAELMAALEADLAARLGGGGGGGGGSSTDGASSSGGGGSSIPSPLPALPMAMGVEVPTEVDVRLSLSGNARRLLEHRLTRSLGPSEAAALEETLSEAIPTFYADTAGLACVNDS